MRHLWARAGRRGLAQVAAAGLLWMALASPVAASGGGSAAASGPAGPSAALSPFTDLGGVPWAAPQIALLQAQGVVTGVSASRFGPGRALTEQAAVTLLARLFLPAGAAGPANPLPGVAGWAQAAVDWAQAKGVVRNRGAFAPGNPATRAQVAAWVVRALGLTCQCSPQSDLHFADAGAIPSAYRQDDTVAAVDGLFVGGANNDFHPAEPITRAQMAVVLVRAEEALAQRGAAAAPLTWAASGPGIPTSDTWKGAARIGTASLPVGSIQGGTLSLQGPQADLHESFLRWSDAGAVSISGTDAGRAGAVRAVWRGGVLWAGGGTATYTGSTAGGSISYRATVNCGSGCSRTEGATFQTKTASGGTETARSCTYGTQCLGYRGPALPGPALLTTAHLMVIAALANAGAGG